jgi:hypothetical protein
MVMAGSRRGEIARPAGQGNAERATVAVRAGRRPCAHHEQVHWDELPGEGEADPHLDEVKDERYLLQSQRKDVSNQTRSFSSCRLEDQFPLALCVLHRPPPMG